MIRDHINIHGRNRPLVLEIYSDDAGVSAVRHELDAAGVPGRHALEQWALVLATAVELVAEQTYGGLEEGGSAQLTVEMMIRVTDRLLERSSRMEEEYRSLHPEHYDQLDGGPEENEGGGAIARRKPVRPNEWADYEAGLRRAVVHMLEGVPTRSLSGLVDSLASSQEEDKPYARLAILDLREATAYLYRSRTEELDSSVARALRIALEGIPRGQSDAALARLDAAEKVAQGIDQADIRRIRMALQQMNAEQDLLRELQGFSDGANEGM